MAWIVEFDQDAQKDFLKLASSHQKKILKYLRSRVSTEEDPRRFGAPLRKTLAGFWKYRIGDCRLVCKIEEHKLIVLVLVVGLRKNVYQKASSKLKC